MSPIQAVGVARPRAIVETTGPRGVVVKGSGPPPGDDMISVADSIIGPDARQSPAVGEIDEPDLSNLFVRKDVGPEVESLIKDVPRGIRALRRALLGPLPDVAIGDHCHEPHDCPFLKRCWPEPPLHAIETQTPRAKIPDCGSR